MEKQKWFQSSDLVGARASRIHKLALGLLIGALAVTAGCSGLRGNDDTSTELRIADQDGTDHAVLVEISQNEQVVYPSGRIIDAESDTETESLNRTGEYDVTISVDGESTVTSYTFEGGDAVTTIGVDNEGIATIGTWTAVQARASSDFPEGIPHTYMQE